MIFLMTAAAVIVPWISVAEEGHPEDKVLTVIP
jgi:hypothetical protein